MPKQVTVSLGPWTGISLTGGGGSQYAFFSYNQRFHALDTGGDKCGVEMRGGTQRVHASALTISTYSNLFAWDKGGQLLVKGTSTTLYYTTSTTIPYTWNSATTPASGNNGYNHFAAFRDASADVVYISENGAAGLMKWTGAAASSVGGGTPTSLGGLAVYNSRLFAFGGSSTNSSTLYWSGLNNGDTLGLPGSGGGSAVIRHYRDDPITGLVALGQTLFIFHRGSITKFTGWSQDDFNIADGLRGFSPDIGMPTLASGVLSPPQTLITVNQEGYFWDTNRGRCYRFTEGGLEDISAPIRADLVGYGYVGSFDPPSAVVHIPSRQEIWWKISFSIGIWYGWNYGLKAWIGKWDTPPSLDGKIVSCGTNWNNHFVYGASDNFIREMFHDPASTVYLDDVLSNGTGGAVIKGLLGAKTYFNVPDLGGEAALRRVRVHLLPHFVNPNGESSLYIDDPLSAPIIYPITGAPTSGYFANNNTVQVYDLNVSGYSRYWVVAWTNNLVAGTVRPPTLLKIELDFLVYAERGGAGVFHS